MIRLAALLLGLLAAAPALAAELTLVGLDGRSVALEGRELKAMPRVALKLDPDDIAPFEGVELKTLFARTGLIDFEDVRGPLLAVVMVVRASDGYVVALPLSELDPAFARGRVVLADSWNGKALGPEEGPFRLIVEGDQRPARSAYAVTGIELRSLR